MAKKAIMVDAIRKSMVSYIKGVSKDLKESGKGFEETRIFFTKWVNGLREWTSNDIRVNGEKFVIDDYELTSSEFIKLVKDALAESKCKGIVLTKEHEECVGFRYVHYESFDKLLILSAPCKEFVSLNKMLKKYCNKELGLLDIKSSRVCGKRNNWGISDTDYLCYQPERCQAVIDFIKSNKTTRDILSFKVVNELYKGDGYQYAYAMETEWYGAEYDYIELVVTTPNGKVKGELNAKAKYKW